MPILRKIVFKCLYTFLFIGGVFFLSSQKSPDREYQIKAVFLFNFTQFVEWPVSALPEEKTQFVIGILGDDPFGSYLETILSNEKVGDHSITIHRYRRVEEIKACHVLFINSKEKDKIAQIHASLKGRSILTVSDEPNFINKGGMIKFFTVSNKIHFQINPQAAQSADLKISSKLLRLAEIVIPNKNN